MTKTNSVKSVTPKYTIDWYFKWVASAFILSSMSLRGVDGFAMYDLSFSIIGVSLWCVVSFLWNDRALIILNLAGLGLLLRTFVGTMFP